METIGRSVLSRQVVHGNQQNPRSKSVLGRAGSLLCEWLKRISERAF